jgi:hypothetical protein
LTASFPDDLATLLKEHHEVLDPELREKLVGSLVLLRRKDVVDSATYDMRTSPNCVAAICSDYNVI